MSKRTAVLVTVLLTLGLVTTCRPSPDIVATPTPLQPGETPTHISTSTPLPVPSPTLSATSFLPPGLIPIEPGNAATIQQLADIQIVSAKPFVYHLDFSPDSRILVAWARGPATSWAVELWDLTSGQKLLTLGEWHGEPQILSFPNGDFAATIMMYVKPHIYWNPISRDYFPLLNSDDLYAAFSPGLEYLIKSPSHNPDTSKSTVVLIDTQDGEPVHTLEIDAFLMAVAFSPDSSIVALGPGGSTDLLDTTVWDVITGERLAALPHASELIFSPDGRLAAVVLDIGMWIGVFRTGDWGEHIHVGEGTGTVLDNPSFTPDGRILAATNAHRVTLWNVANGKELVNFGSSEEPITNFALSPDGKLLATCDDGTVRLWGILP